MFAITNSKGFHMTFANDWTVSVQWGPGNYCENYSEPFTTMPADWISKTAEVWAWHESANGKRDCYATENPLAYQSPDEVARFIAEVAARPH